MLEAGQVVLAQVQFTDSFETKKRPAVVLFEEFTNVVAGITSNPNMKGSSLTKKEGAVKDCVIKTNYIFTITEKAIEKKLFNLSAKKKSELYENLNKKLKKLTKPKNLNAPNHKQQTNH